MELAFEDLNILQHATGSTVLVTNQSVVLWWHRQDSLSGKPYLVESGAPATVMITRTLPTTRFFSSQGRLICAQPDSILFACT